jgi:hypothetical protein
VRPGKLLACPEGPAGGLLIAERTTVQLDPAAFTTDVAEFHAALRGATHAPDLTERRARLRGARERLLPERR